MLLVSWSRTWPAEFNVKSVIYIEESKKKYIFTQNGGNCPIFIKMFFYQFVIFYNSAYFFYKQLFVLLLVSNEFFGIKKFAENCFDSFYQNGGVTSLQFHPRYFINIEFNFKFIHLSRRSWVVFYGN